MESKPSAPGIRSPRRTTRIFFWLIFLITIGLAWQWLKIYQIRVAVFEATKLGWEWKYDDPFEVVKKDWKAFFRASTWLDGQKHLTLRTSDELVQHQELVQRLSPQQLKIQDWTLADLAPLERLSGLRELSISSSWQLTDITAIERHGRLKKLSLNLCTSLKNAASIKKLGDLEELNLTSDKALTDLEILEGLQRLKTLRLDGCSQIKSLRSLSSLQSLEVLWIEGCDVKDLSPLKSLSHLKYLSIGDPSRYSTQEISAIELALPKTEISPLNKIRRPVLITPAP